MSRTIKTRALVLKMNPVGENHRGITLLAADEGLIRPLAFGAQGRRSPLRATARPFNAGTANLYYDGVKSQWRLIEFDPDNTHEGLNENLDRFYTATTWAEILLNTHGSGNDSASLFNLADTAMNLLSKTKGEQIHCINIGFFWHFLGIEGIQPDPMCCGICGSSLPLNTSKYTQYRNDGALFGPECSNSYGQKIPNTALIWLARISSDFNAVLSMTLDSQKLLATEQWLTTIIQNLLERPLKSLNASQGIDYTTIATGS